MRPIRDLFYIRSDASLETTHKFASGKEIYISEPIVTADHTKSFSPYERAVQFGEIVHCPMQISIGQIYDVELAPGDRIYFHHFIVQPDNCDEIKGETLYRCAYKDIFCVIKNGEIIPVQDYCFLSYIEESKLNLVSPSGIFLKPQADTLRNIAKVEATSKVCKELGLEIGDKVVWMNDSDYKMKVEGKELIRMSFRRIVGKVVEP